MSQQNSSTKFKLGFDLFYIQMQWSLWYIPIVLISYFLVLRFAPNIEERNLNLIYYIFQPSKIYMGVIAIISCFAFMGYSVKNGITRRDYFWGSALASVGVAFSIMILSAILAGILEVLGLVQTYSSIIDSIVILDTTTLWIVSILSLGLILLSYYIAGWIVAVGFYRFGGIIGIGFVVVALLFVSITELIWEGEVTHPLGALFEISLPGLSVSVSILVSLTLIAIGLYLIRYLTKRVAVKIE